MKRLLQTGIACLSLFALPPCASAEETVTYNYYLISCGKFTQHRDTSDTENATSDSYYVAGWISAYNKLSPESRAIDTETDLSSILLWLDGYCRDHPLSNVSEALSHLPAELRAAGNSSATAPSQQPPPQKSGE